MISPDPLPPTASTSLGMKTPENTAMTLYQLMKEISKWNTTLD